MKSVLIDGYGQVWASTSREMRVAYDSPYSGGEFTTYAVKNLGFIHICIYSRSCHVSFRPDLATAKAIEACKDWTRCAPVIRYVLALEHTACRFDLLTSHMDLLRKIDAAVSHSRMAGDGDYLAAPRQTAPKPAVVQILERLQSGPIDFRDVGATMALSHAIQATFGRRFLVVKPDISSPHLIFDAIGDDLFADFREWRQAAVGTPVEALPDPHFGAWASKTYRDVLESQTPVFDDVDAIVKWPRIGRVRLRYNRAIVPFVTASGTPMLITGSTTDASVDLRIKSA